MSSTTQKRWPNFGEQLTIAAVIAGLGWFIGELLRSSDSWSTKVLIIICFFFLLFVFSSIYERFRSAKIIAIFTDEEYEEILTNLAHSHKGDIDWITKTSIWAALPTDHHNRRFEKIKGLRVNRIRTIRYIISNSRSLLFI